MLWPDACSGSLQIAAVDNRLLQQLATGLEQRFADKRPPAGSSMPGMDPA